MCDPITANVMFIAATALGATVSAKASYDQGQAAKKASEYNARVMENQVQDVKNQATDAMTAERQKAAQLRSQQRAIAASRGADVDFGTALNIQEDTEMIGRINAQRIQNTSDAQVQSLTSQALLTRAEGKNAARQGTMQAMGTLLGAGGSIAGKMINPSTTVNPSWYQNGAEPSGAAGFGPGADYAGRFSLMKG